MRPESGSRNRFVFIILVLACLTLLSLQARGNQNAYVSQAQNATFGVISSMQSGVGRMILPVSGAWRSVRELSAIRRQNQVLALDNSRLRGQLRRMEGLKDENDRLRAMVGFKEKHDYTLLSARVVARSVNEWQSAVIINKGSAEGIAKNMAVVESSGLVGKTITVTKHASKVLLLIDRRCAVGVKVLESNESGLTEGAEGSSVPLRYLDRAAKVKVDDEVITSGLGGVFPPGIMVGWILEIDKPSLSVEKNVTIKPAVDFNRLDEVMVIRNSPPLPPDFLVEK